MGLPMEDVFSEEIGILRAEGARLMEVSGLATHRTNDYTFIMEAFRVLYAYARYSKNVTDLCIAVATKHQRFYEEALLFETLGPVRNYSSLNKVSAVAMHLDLEMAEERYKAAHRKTLIGRLLLKQDDFEQVISNLSTPTAKDLATRYEFSRKYLDWSRLGPEIRSCIDDAYNRKLDKLAGLNG